MCYIYQISLRSLHSAAGKWRRTSTQLHKLTRVRESVPTTAVVKACRTPPSTRRSLTKGTSKERATARRTTPLEAVATDVIQSARIRTRQERSISDICVGSVEDKGMRVCTHLERVVSPVQLLHFFFNVFFFWSAKLNHAVNWNILCQFENYTLRCVRLIVLLISWQDQCRHLVTIYWREML